MDKREMGLRRVKENIGIIDCSEYSLSVCPMCVCPFLLVSCTSGCCHSALCDGWKEVASALLSSVLRSHTPGCFAGDRGAL